MPSCCIWLAKAVWSRRTSSPSRPPWKVSLMPEVVIRKRLVTVEEIFHENGPPAEKPLRRAAILTAIENPFAGRYVAEIAPFMNDLEPLGLAMARTLVAALGGDPK